MTLIKTRVILPFIVLLLFTAGAGIPADTAGGQSITMLAATDLHAQEIQKPDQTVSHDQEKKPEPSKTLYQVMGVVLIIWAGIAFFLFRLDRRVAKLENQVKIK